MSDNFSITEAARILGISTKTVSRQLKSGKLKGVVVDGKRKVLLPDTTGQRDRTSVQTDDRTSVQTQADTHSIEVLRAERDQARAERDREREEVQFLRQRNAELNSIVMRHALSLPTPKGPGELESSTFESGTMPRDTTGQVSPQVAGHSTGHDRTTKRTPRRKQLPFWVRFFGFR